MSIRVKVKFIIVVRSKSEIVVYMGVRFDKVKRS